jgi:hypothetical protein
MPSNSKVIGAKKKEKTKPWNTDFTYRVHLDKGCNDELSYNLDKNNDSEEMV